MTLLAGNSMAKKSAPKKYINPDEEPVLLSENPESQIIELLNWYNYHKTKDDAKTYFLEYLQSCDVAQPITKISSLDNITFNNNIGWLCRIFKGNPVDFPKKYVKNIEEAKARVLQVVVTQPDELPIEQKHKPSIQENIANQLKAYIGDLDVILDQFVEKKCVGDFSLYQWLKSKNVKHYQAKDIANHFESTLLKELVEAKDGVCEQLKEAYSFLTPEQLDAYIKFVQSFVADGDLWEKESKQLSSVNRAPRTKKQKSPTKLVEKLNFLKQGESFTSINPTEIIGASQLLVYNIKTRVLSWYVCTNPHGLSVKGSTLLNFDETQSYGKTLRKPDVVIPQIITSAKPTIKKLITNIKAKEKKLTGRINKDTILLKVL